MGFHCNLYVGEGCQHLTTSSKWLITQGTNIMRLITVEPLYSGLLGTSDYGGFLIMEVKLYSKVLVWDLNECP